MMLARLRSLITQPAIITSAAVTLLLVGVQRLGLLEPMELKAFDQMMQIRPDPGPDKRILVVTVTEEDLQKWNWPLTGEIIDHTFSKIEKYQPRAIGLDIFRDLPVEPGHEKLLKHIQTSDRIVPVCKHADSINPDTPPPPGLESERVGFGDILPDTDDIVRRNLLVITPDNTSRCVTPYSLGLKLALSYLNIEPQSSPQQDLMLGKTVFKRLQSDSGGYHNVDARGYQILLNYRSAHKVAEQVTLTDVLSDRLTPALVKDRIVLIGITAPSVKDAFNTPYSSRMSDNQKMPGVILHAQMASQILSAVADGRQLFWFWSEWQEILWCGVWTLTGGFLAWRIQHPLRLGFAGIVSLGALLGSNFLLFTQVWVPIVPPVLGLVLAMASVLTYGAFRAKQQQEKITQQVQQQERTISLLQTLLREGGKLPSTTEVNTLRPDSFLNQRYKITKSLGSGGFSNTFLADDTQRPSQPKCVVKYLQPARKDLQFLDIARRLFKTEGEILELLGTHDRIPYLLAYFEENEQFYLVQEFIDGNSLYDELYPAKPLSESQVVEILKDVLEILVFVHSYGVIHRDIKPANIIRRQRDRRLVLIDFGAVKQIQPQQPEDGNQTIAIGTAGYAPPEQMMGQPRISSDIYALGMIGIQALTGISPKFLERDPDTSMLLWHRQAITPELAKILDRMVDFDPSKRYQSASEVLKGLDFLVLA
jgi:CHASE2 domain-containing sensor protein/predicted Ser/Thr protein kinase